MVHIPGNGHRIRHSRPMLLLHHQRIIFHHKGFIPGNGSRLIRSPFHEHIHSTRESALMRKTCATMLNICVPESVTRIPPTYLPMATSPTFPNDPLKRINLCKWNGALSTRIKKLFIECIVPQEFFHTGTTRKRSDWRFCWVRRIEERPNSQRGANLEARGMKRIQIYSTQSLVSFRRRRVACSVAITKNLRLRHSRRASRE
mmetsp:Transcript_11278/g.42247  ORF Transcript_11278/g.42247 Transcript_11278/m.42247 type:complete len:202 (-) Transcript_11278:1656-2261(-)